MAFSSVFVVSNSLRLRNYKDETLSKQKTISSQLLGFVPRLVAVALALTVLVVLSTGRLPRSISYRASIVPNAPIVAGVSTPLEIRIVDKYGQPFSDFETVGFGRFSYNIFLAVASRDLTFMEADPLLLGLDNLMAGAGGGSGGSMSMGSAPTTQGSPTPNPLNPPVDTGTIKIQAVFPKDGQYIAFLEFWPRGGVQKTLLVPIQVGSATTPDATLTADPSLVQEVDNLKITLSTNGSLKAGEPQFLNFTAIDPAGQLRNEEIEMLSGYRCNLYVLNEKLTTFLKPELINRQNLQFSVDFPKPGIYKIWFEFIYANRLQQVSYILEVK
jgi:hypothetical protein